MSRSSTNGARPVTVLARFCFPSADLPGRDELFVRLSSGAELLAGGGVLVGKDGCAQFDTYVNALSLGKWARYTTLSSLTLAVQVSGACRLDVVHDAVGEVPAVLASVDVDASELSWFELDLPPFDAMARKGAHGGLYLRVLGVGGQATIRQARWQSTEEPPRTVRLGLVITTFNRQAQVRTSVERILQAIDEQPERASQLEVIVVDNARNLTLDLPPRSPVSVLPNANTGGAGGFTRGLMHFRCRPETTHVLFMDDDVSFDPEIVFRTMKFLGFARSAELCLTGAMLREKATTEQFEAGARFVAGAVYPTRAVGQGLDLLSWRDLLVAETEREHIDYGAWWYFAFPLSLTPDNPVPMFLRGDDVCWGLMHAGQHTVTLNGIGLWHEDFERKNGPLTWFYDTRNFALIGALALPGYTGWHLLWRYLNTCGRSLLCFKYTSAAHITWGLREFLAGPEHWLALDHPKLHEVVAAYEGERIQPLGPVLRALPGIAPRRRPRKLAAALGSVVALGGHLLPGSLQRRPMVAVPVQQRAIDVAVWRDEILYRDEEAGHGFVARRDRRRFFALLGEMIVTAVRIPLRFPVLRRAYLAAYPRLVSDESWRQSFDQPSPPSPPRPGQRETVSQADATAAAGPDAGVADLGPEPASILARPDRERLWTRTL